MSFELFIINSWDGNDTSCCGPDIWDLSVSGGPTLLHTTFGTHDPRFQAYPGTYPGSSNEWDTGASEEDTLGYTFTGNAVYNLCFTFPHSSGSLGLDFSATGLQGLGDESWGLDNVLVGTDLADSDGDGLVDVCDPDDDNDGVDDEDDPFPNSDLSATVAVGDCDSGVENQSLGNGATFNDMIGAAAAAAKNHGAFVSKVSKLADEWKKGGLISGKEKGKITSCAARSDIP